MSGGRIVAPGATLALDWSVCSRSKHGDADSGDGFVLQGDGALVTAAVVDGTGSGQDAAAAAQTCIDQIVQTGSDELSVLFAACQQRLRGSRGAALALATIDLAARRLVWAAVGEVDGLVIRAGERTPRNRPSILQSAGTLGYSYNRVQPMVLRLVPGDAILMTTDGIRRTCRTGALAGLSPVEMARTAVANYSKAEDDALALALVLDHIQ